MSGDTVFFCWVWVVWGGGGGGGTDPEDIYIIYICLKKKCYKNYVMNVTLNVTL